MAGSDYVTTARIFTGDEHADVRAAVTELRARLRQLGAYAPSHGARVARAFASFDDVWQHRLTEGWLPPAGSDFPWAQVRLSLAALLPGFAAAGEWLGRSVDGESANPATTGGVVALVLAGNTPLLAWPALAAALLTGHAVFVKMSRDETLWPRLFLEALAEVDPELATLVHLDVWPGDDPRTADLVGCCDAVVAYGSDRSVGALRRTTPAPTPLYGFGHAISVGLVLPSVETAALENKCRPSSANPDVGLRRRLFSEAVVSTDGPAYGTGAAGFARDVLMYDQAGCLSPQCIFVTGGSDATKAFAGVLADGLDVAAATLDVADVTDPGVSRAVRTARDMALFDGFQVMGDDRLRWTVAYTDAPSPLPPTVGYAFVHVVPFDGPLTGLPEAFGWARGRVSCVGVAGDLPVDVTAAFASAGVSRICRPGEMQTPPLDWPNGGIDLLHELVRLRR